MNTLLKASNIYIFTVLLIVLNLLSAVFYPVNVFYTSLPAHLASILLIGGLVLFMLYHNKETVAKFKDAPTTVLASVMFIGSLLIAWYFIFPASLVMLLVIIAAIVVVALVIMTVNRAIEIIADHANK